MNVLNRMSTHYDLGFLIRCLIYWTKFSSVLCLWYTLKEHEKNLTFATISKNSDRDFIMGIYEKFYIFYILKCSMKTAIFCWKIIITYFLCSQGDPTDQETFQDL